MGRKKGLVLTDRDILLLSEVSSFKFLLARQIKLLAGFPSLDACFRRVKKLLEYNFLEYRHILYNIPGLYFLGQEARRLPFVRYYSYKINLDEIYHDLAVIDTAIWSVHHLDFEREFIKTERELHSMDGFSMRKHQPDFIYEKDGQRICVEVEFSIKSKDNFERILKRNHFDYDGQIWVVPKKLTTVHKRIKESGYPDINIIDWEMIERSVREL